jgi:histidine ammonia-lyase
VIREKVPPIVGDRRFSEDIEKISSLIESGVLLQRVETVLGGLA